MKVLIGGIVGIATFAYFIDHIDYYPPEIANLIIVMGILGIFCLLVVYPIYKFIVKVTVGEEVDYEED
ncbi:MAG: hypothetical protein JRI50_10680 [Deltaproteobacteria bacterium]|nr:hypothetical protein [Deltaproteobacteria bacterium]MBW1987665.1 hypothetical protein [Deltaproteobacteria bacterium]